MTTTMEADTWKPLHDDSLTTEWVNYGDVNPDKHGGKFIRWDDSSEGWQVVETTPPEDLPDDLTTTSHLVDEYWFYPDDVWEGGDHREGFTDAMQGILESLNEHRRLEHPAVLDVDTPLEYYVADLTHYHHSTGRGETWVDAVSYWSWLEECYGIEDENL